MPSNNSFKPKLLRSGKNMAEKTCHVFTSTTRFGLIQALALRHVAFFAVELRNACLVCSSVHRSGHMATDSVQPRTAALRLCANFPSTAPEFNRTTGVQANSLGKTPR